MQLRRFQLKQEFDLRAITMGTVTAMICSLLMHPFGQLVPFSLRGVRRHVSIRGMVTDTTSWAKRCTKGLGDL